MKKFDEKKLRELAGCFPTGVTVVTTENEDGTVHGMTASSFLYVSISPALVLFSVKKENQLAQLIAPGKPLGISVLTESMISESNHFAKIALMDPPPSFEKQTDVYVLPNAHAWYRTQISECIEAGDHFLVLCEVVAFEAFPEQNPLVYYQGYKTVK